MSVAQGRRGRLRGAPLPPSGLRGGRASPEWGQRQPLALPEPSWMLGGWWWAEPWVDQLGSGPAGLGGLGDPPIIYTGA